jgi:hypothetical protein
MATRNKKIIYTVFTAYYAALAVVTFWISLWLQSVWLYSLLVASLSVSFYCWYKSIV